MLYLGLGTGVGTTLIADGAISQIAVGQLPFKDGKAFDEFLAKDAIDEIGLEAWRQAVGEAATLLKNAMLADYVLLGGSGAEKFDELPKGCRARGKSKRLFWRPKNVGGYRHPFGDAGPYSVMPAGRPNIDHDA